MDAAMRLQEQVIFLMMLDFQDTALSDRDFFRFKNLVHEKCGIFLHDGKKELVRARLGKRLRATRFKSFSEYYRYLMETDSGDELAQMLNAISTNLTSFFRESNHFTYLENNVFPHLFGSGRSRQIRAWSAGCSSGEEPYSLAMCLKSFLKTDSSWEINILATDISTEVLSTGLSGVYPGSRIQNLPTDLVRNFFQKGQHRWDGFVRVKPFIRNMIDFRRFNLISPFSFEKRFDIIFCRNVMIYFNRAAQESLVNKFYKCLHPGGYLFIGHSESLLSIRHPFKYIKPTIYQRQRA